MQICAVRVEALSPKQAPFFGLLRGAPRMVGSLPRRNFEKLPGFEKQTWPAGRRLQGDADARAGSLWEVEGSFPKEGDPNISPNIL